jgi:hypothetical protein
MAEAKEFDWGKVAGRTTTNLRAPKIPDVPAPIVKLAEESYHGKPTGATDDEGKPILGHVMEYDFGKGNEEMASAFAKHMRNAGHHTHVNGSKHETSVSVAQDPENDGSKHIVRWRTGEKKGRKSAPSGSSE